MEVSPRRLTVREQREALIAALIAIFRNGDAEEAAGILAETEEDDRLHREYHALADRAPWWVRVGVWRQASRRYERMKTAEERRNPGPRVSVAGLGYVSCGECGEVYDIGPGDPIACPRVDTDDHDVEARP